MDDKNIDYEDLKKRGFLRSREEELFTLRTKVAAGNYRSGQLNKLADIAEKYGRGFVHLTVRQGIEIPFISFDNIEEVERELKSSSVQPGASGARLRVTTCCPGNNWCKRGLVDTFSLFKKIEDEINLKCGMDLPHKFKIAISGCPNTCTRAQVSEIGVHGQMDIMMPEAKVGYAIYLGGCGGRTPRVGLKINKIFREEEVLSLIEKVVNFYKANAKPRQRLALMIEEIGQEKFLQEMGIGDFGGIL